MRANSPFSLYPARAHHSPCRHPFPDFGLTHLAVVYSARAHDHPRRHTRVSDSGLTRSPLQCVSVNVLARLAGSLGAAHAAGAVAEVDAVVDGVVAVALSCLDTMIAPAPEAILAAAARLMVVLPRTWRGGGGGGGGGLTTANNGPASYRHRP